MTEMIRSRGSGRFGPPLASLFFLCLVGCNDSNPASSLGADTAEVAKSSAANEPDLSFASKLGISARSVSEQEARRIAELATGGTAVSVESEDEDGETIFEVTVRVDGRTKEVEVRIRDGAVLEIEDED